MSASVKRNIAIGVALIVILFGAYQFTKTRRQNGLEGGGEQTSTLGVNHATANSSGVHEDAGISETANSGAVNSGDKNGSGTSNAAKSEGESSTAKPNVANHTGLTVASTNPTKATGATTESTQVTPGPVVKEKPNFPGITQAENKIMVSDVRYEGGEGQDQIIVTLTQVEGTEKKTGTLWVIAEYIQRGTTGTMYMPSHKELKLSPDGQPKNSKTGTAFALSTSVKKLLTIIKPGFEGEELTGVRVGVVDHDSSEVHVAKISMKRILKRPTIKRVKLNVDDPVKR